MKKLNYISDLFAPIDYSTTPVRVTPRADLEEDMVKKFWRYHGRFPNDFARAIVEILPKGTTFVSYDHLANSLTVK
tara:strand:+ start:2461 stop:2688 length:228 start_codon:yes stop_codon:yes gene_type:complete